MDEDLSLGVCMETEQFQVKDFQMETARDGVLQPIIINLRESDSKSCNDDDTE
jgi:hypothetical protein